MYCKYKLTRLERHVACEGCAKQRTSTWELASRMWLLLLATCLLTLFPCHGANDVADCKALQQIPRADAECVVAASVRGSSEAAGSTYAVRVTGLVDVGACNLESDVPEECWSEGGAALLVNASAHAEACSAGVFQAGQQYLLSLELDKHSCPVPSAVLRLGPAREAAPTSRVRIARQTDESELVRK